MRTGGNGSGTGSRPRGRARAAVAVVVVALLLQSLGLGQGRVAAQDGAGPPAETSAETAPPVPTTAPEPVVVAEPTAAPEPSPTAAPTEPTQAEAAQPPAEPIASPAPTEELPTPTPDATATATATATVEIEPTATPAPAPDALDCAPVDGAAAQPGQLVEFGCVLVVGSAWGAVRITVAPESTTGLEPSEWTVAADAVGAADGELAAAASFEFAVRVRVPAQASAGDTATVAVSVADPGRADASPVVARFAVTALAPPPDDLTCAAAGTVEVPAGESVDLACSLTVNSARVGTRLETAVSASGEPWAVELAPAPVEVTDPDPTALAITTLDEATALEPGDTVDLTLRLTAPESAETGEEAEITLATGRITMAEPDPALDDAEFMLAATVEEAEFGAASVVNQTGSLSCTNPSPDTVGPGGIVQYTCTFPTCLIAPAGSFQIGSMINGWQHQVVLGSTTTARTSSSQTINFGGLLGLANPMTVRIWLYVPVSGIALGDQGTVNISFTSTGTACTTKTGSATLTSPTALTIQSGASSSYAAITCAAPDGNILPQGGSLGFQCSIAATASLSALGLASLGLDNLLARQAGSGLTGAVSAGGSSALLGVNLDLVALSLSLVSAQPFTLTLNAPCTAVAGSFNAINITSTISLRLIAGVVTTQEPGPWVSIPVQIGAASSSGMTATFVSSETPLALGTAEVSGLSGATKAGSVDVRVSRAACASATIAVGVTSSGGGTFDAPVGVGGNPIPLADLVQTGVTGPPSEPGLTVISSPGAAFTTNPAVATVNAVEGTATYSLTLDASLAVPADTRAGTHTATLQVTVVGGAP